MNGCDILLIMRMRQFIHTGVTRRAKMIEPIHGAKKKLIRYWDNAITPPLYLQKNEWDLTHINPCWRFVRSSTGSDASPHLDANYVQSIRLKSVYTVLIYLTDHMDGQLVFTNNNMPSVAPRIGRMVIFDQSLVHQALLHTETKYLIRSEIMASRSSVLAIETEADKQAMQLYKKAIECFYSDPVLSLQRETSAFELSPELENIIY